VAGRSKEESKLWDFFQDGRLAMIGEGMEEGCDNVFLAKSELCSTGCFQTHVTLSGLADMHHVGEDEERYFKSRDRTAQRGSSWDLAILRGLLTSPATSAGEGPKPWTTAHDTVDILDLHPYLGDGAEATHAAMKGGLAPNTFRHIMLHLNYKTMADHTPFARKRLQRMIEKMWCEGNAPLWNFIMREDGLCLELSPAQHELIACPIVIQTHSYTQLLYRHTNTVLYKLTTNVQTCN
jgi:hypothetical protein